MADDTKPQPRPTRKEMTADYARSVFDYDPLTGTFRWKWRDDVLLRHNRRFAGKIAGTHDRNGHWQLNVFGVFYLGHRIAWLIMTGGWPTDEIDHENTVKDDNRWNNLREATHVQNSYNKGVTSLNTSGYKGVSQCKKSGRWIAQLCVNRVRHDLGRFDTPQAAYAAYCIGALRLHGEFARLK